MTPLFCATKGGRKWLDDVEKAPGKSPFLVKASADDEGGGKRRRGGEVECLEGDRRRREDVKRRPSQDALERE